MIKFVYSCEELEKQIKLPLDLIDIDTGSGRFILRFIAFDKGQNEYSVKQSGITGSFGIVYQSCGMQCEFPIDLTVGNLYLFEYQLDDAYDIMFGRNASAVLENYGTLNRSKFSVVFDKRGRCTAKGHFKNKNNGYTDGISFSAELDQSCIPDMLGSMMRFFDKLRELQGHGYFY